MRLGIALITALTLAGGAQAKNMQTAVLAGGCFWCVESDLEGLNGVQDVVSGFSGGSKENANYKTVTKKKTSHREAVEVTFDADVISYEELVDVFPRRKQEPINEATHTLSSVIGDDCRTLPD